MAQEDHLDDLHPEVFISYAHADKPFVHRLAAALEERGCTPWVDEFMLRTGDSLTERISGAVTDADFVVTVISAASVQSNWCRRELSMALATGLGDGRTIVLPVRLGKVTMPPSLADILYLEADPDDPDGAAERLVADMGSHAEEVERRRQLELETPQVWAWALEPAHELDVVLADLQEGMAWLWDADAPTAGRVSYAAAFERWMTAVDRQHSGGRLPEVLVELCHRLEDLLALAARHAVEHRREKGTLRRLRQIVTTGLLSTRDELSATVANPEILAASALEDCSIPEGDELARLVAEDPSLKALRARVVPSDEHEDEERDGDRPA